MNSTDGKNPYSYIDCLSMKELELLLRAGVLSPEDGDPDLMDYLLEVIVEREKNMPDSKLPDTRKVLEKFNALYRGLKEPLYDSSSWEESLDSDDG